MGKTYRKISRLSASFLVNIRLMHTGGLIQARFLMVASCFTILGYITVLSCTEPSKTIPPAAISTKKVQTEAIAALPPKSTQPPQNSLSQSAESNLLSKRLKKITHTTQTMPSQKAPRQSITAAKTKNILLLGFDKYGRLPGRTDAIIIASIRHDLGKIGLVSIPRDIWVDLPNYEAGRINKAYRVGNKLHGKGGGEKLLKKIIKRDFGIAIDNTVAIDFNGFKKTVDLLGGIDVDVRCPLKDNFVSKTSPNGYEALSLNAGKNRMNGNTALLFARSRHGRGDLDRSRRQQAIIGGLKNRLMSIDVLMKLPELWTLFTQNVKTDLNFSGAVEIIRLARATKPTGVHGLVLKKPVIEGFKSIDGKSVLKLNKAAFKTSWANMFKSTNAAKTKKQICKPIDAALKWKKNKKRKQKIMSPLDMPA